MRATDRMRLGRIPGGSSSDLRSDSSATASELTSLYRFGVEDRARSSLLNTSQSMPSLERDGDGDTVLTNFPTGHTRLLHQSLASSAATNSAQALSITSGKPLKVVSGSQFRLTSRGLAPCEQCLLFDKASKRNKEVIRSLKLQLMRMEESYRDLKFTKNNDSEPDAKLTLDSDVKLGGVGVGVGGGDSNLRRKCDYLEEELNKFKKMLSYERGVNDGLRQTLEQDRVSRKTSSDALEQENARFKIYVSQLETTNTHYVSSYEDAHTKLMAYKQQLEKTELRLAECLE
jgi:hypothetical protein